jgi:hypothetical protein
MLKDASAQFGRSLNAEIVRRLEASFEAPEADALDEMREQSAMLALWLHRFSKSLRSQGIKVPNPPEGLALPEVLDISDDGHEDIERPQK